MHSLSSQALSDDRNPAFNRPRHRLFWGVSRHPVSNTSTPKKLLTQFVKGHKSIPSLNQWIPALDTESLGVPAALLSSSCETLIKVHEVERQKCRAVRGVTVPEFYGAMARMPQGPVPALMCLVTLNVARSTSVTSFEGPFAE